jgi:hypothetical protein
MSIAALAAVTLSLVQAEDQAFRSFRLQAEVSAAIAPQDPHAQHKAAMDHRGHQAMGFDQAKVKHTFSPSADGGTIDVAALDPADAVTIRQIRGHLKEIAKLFKAGDFSKPVFIHAQDPPGADVMKARRQDIQYRFEETPSGGRLAISSADAKAIAAIQAFVTFQRDEHKR